MDALVLGPVKRAAGRVALPGSKSISNRVLLLAALAAGEVEVSGLLDAEDTQVMLDALRALGVRIHAKGTLRIEGVQGVFPVKQARLHLGNAGTAMRPLTAALAFSPGGEYVLSGVPRMHERPIGDLVEALRGAGASIRYLEKQGFPPLEIRGGGISLERPVKVRGDVSSQYLTALLMALPLARKACAVHVEGELISRPYIEITLNLMRRFGVEVARHAWQAFEIPARAYASPGAIRVEGDASSASYFLAAGAIGGGPVRVQGVGRDSIQGDVRFTEVLEKMGAEARFYDDAIEVRGDGRKLRAFDTDMNHIPDAAMTAAVMALFAAGPSVIRNIASWRVKETDRIAAMATELRKLGAAVEEGGDFIRIDPPAALADNVAIDTYNDHRMAMSFSLVALGGVRVRINDPGCVAKTFPGYFQAFGRITT